MTLSEALTAPDPCVEPRKGFPLGFWLPLGAAIAIYLTLALWLAAVKVPWCDEAWFANPAYNLAFHGQMSTNLLEPTGHLLKANLRGIQQRTYIVVPNHLVALAGWYRLVGFSLFKTRVYSIFWGALTLAVWFYILRQFFSDRRVAQFAVLLMAIDFVFLWSTADGRMEAPTNALALCGIAAYLRFRERRLGMAVFLSQAFGAAAVFTHPNAVMLILILALIAWRYDRRQLRLQYLALAAAPYLVFAGLWSIYILQSPADFAAQFFANAAGPGDSRWRVLFRPWLAVGLELERHLGVYAAGGPWSAFANQWMMFVPLGYLGAMVWFVRHYRRWQEPLRTFFFATLAMLGLLTFVNGFKAHFYFMYIIPFYDAVLAAWLLNLWSRAADAKVTACAILAGFLIVQISTSVQHIRADEYRRDYLPATADVERLNASGKTIIASSSLGFGTTFTGFADDARLGMYSGIDADVVVVDRVYRVFTQTFEKEEPEAFSYILKTLTTRYRLVKQDGSYWIFERAPQSPDSVQIPSVDLRKIETAPKERKAQRLFELLDASAPKQQALLRSSTL